MVDGQPVVGVIADALRGQVFAAWSGGGATLNGVPIHVSGITNWPQRSFSADTPKVAHLRQQTLAYVARLLIQGRTPRARSAALNMAYIAAGWSTPISTYFEAVGSGPLAVVGA